MATYLKATVWINVDHVSSGRAASDALDDLPAMGLGGRDLQVLSFNRPVELILEETPDAYVTRVAAARKAAQA